MPTLTLRSLRARPVVLTLRRPVVARIASIREWPLVLIDVATEEGIIGRAYLAPYLVKAMRYLVPALNDLGSLLQGRRLAPFELFDTARKSLHFVGYEGLSAIAVAGLDMAAWDALARAANAPLCVLLVVAADEFHDRGVADTLAFDKPVTAPVQSQPVVD